MSTVKKIGRAIGTGVQRVAAVAIAVVMTVVLFMVLPLIQVLAGSSDRTTDLQEWDPVAPPPPPPPPEENEPEPEPETPEFEEAPPLPDLNALSAALDPGAGLGGWGSVDMGASLSSLTGGDGAGGFFNLDQLDQQPRCTHQPPPTLTAKLRKRGPGTVRVIFIVNERGRVENPLVQSTSDPIFNKPALEAVKKWKFDPGMRGGEPVSTRMRVPISFPGPGQ